MIRSRPSFFFSRLFTLAFLLTLPTMAGAKKPDKSAEETKPEGKLVAATFSGLELRNIGPALMSGRIADIAIDPLDRSTWYVAVGSGGVWKTVNAGTTWTPIFDDQGSYSIGDVTLDPSDPNLVWVGTGETVRGEAEMPGLDVGAWSRP